MSIDRYFMVETKQVIRDINDEEEDCDCVVDHEDGSTIVACVKHPKGGSPKSYAVWAAGKSQYLTPGRKQ